MIRFSEGDGPYKFEADLFMAFGYDADDAGSAVTQYANERRNGTPQDEALRKIEELHSLPPGQISHWLEAGQEPELPSN